MTLSGRWMTACLVIKANSVSSAVILRLRNPFCLSNGFVEVGVVSTEGDIRSELPWLSHTMVVHLDFYGRRVGYYTLWVKSDGDCCLICVLSQVLSHAVSLNLVLSYTPRQ
jgi:hypothetical protein